ncbi:hypothetical protein GE061_002350 [Apolygus lucorum]|uniref:Uncharacterized protein n=1 Tax=Apolygus lucorum TaxID=248454 RepID=A0A8S9X6Q5_APOLU|nr:hypothetical protein GE061_002350 [Apolygus lucorum]
MGTVAFIEEKGRVKMGLGMPAGIFTVVAAGVSIHTSRGFSGYKEPNCVPRLRFLGPRPTVAFPLTFLWTAACAFQVSTVPRIPTDQCFLPSNRCPLSASSHLLNGRRGWPGSSEPVGRLCGPGVTGDWATTACWINHILQVGRTSC